MDKILSARCCGMGFGKPSCEHAISNLPASRVNGSSFERSSDVSRRAGRTAADSASANHLLVARRLWTLDHIGCSKLHARQYSVVQALVRVVRSQNAKNIVHECPALRTAKSIGQVAPAGKAGVSRYRLSHAERGLIELTDDERGRIASALDVPVNALFPSGGDSALTIDLVCVSC